MDKIVMETSIGFSRKEVEEIEGPWSDCEKINETLSRMSAQRIPVVRKELEAAESKVVWKLHVFKQVILHRVIMLGRGCAESWNTHNTLASLLCARALIETAALFLDFENQLGQLCENGELGEIDTLVMNRMFSTRNREWLEGGVGRPAVNVLSMIDKLDKLIPGSRELYDRLSEYCHPNSQGACFMFGVLDRENADFRLSDNLCHSDEFLHEVLCACFLLSLVESSIDRIDKHVPRVLVLSDIEKRNK